MGQLLFLGAVVLLVAGAFWFSTRLTMKAGSNVPLPSSLPAAPDGGAAQEIRAFPLVVLSIRTVFRSPAILVFAAASATLGVAQLWLLPTEIRSWLASEQPFSTALVSSLTSTRGLATQLLSGAFDSFVNSWVRVGIAMGALSVIQGGAWGFRDVLGRLRTKARYISSFALLFLLAELPEHIAAALAVVHPMLTFISLLLMAAPFFLGLGAAALACEEKGGLSAARRSISLVQEVWPTRFWGHFLIRMPSMAVGMVFPVVMFVQAYSGSALTLPAAFSGIGLVSLQTIIGIPLLTIGAVFDAALYLRLERQSSAPHTGLPPALRAGEGNELQSQPSIA